MPRNSAHSAHSRMLLRDTANNEATSEVVNRGAIVEWVPYMIDSEIMTGTVSLGLDFDPRHQFSCNSQEKSKGKRGQRRSGPGSPQLVFKVNRPTNRMKVNSAQPTAAKSLSSCDFC
jgi:hypothetical protein